MTKRILTLCAAVFPVLATACGGAPPVQAGGAPPLPPAGADGAYEVDFPTPMPAEDRFIRLTLGPDARTDCVFSPHFALNEVEPLPQDRVALREVAACLNRPEARPHGVALTGHADVRGSGAYNARLGLLRASRVRDLLVAEGIDRGRVRVASRGERGAKGFLAMYAHGYDRRVDIVLDGSHAPDRGTRERGVPTRAD